MATSVHRELLASGGPLLAAFARALRIAGRAVQGLGATGVLGTLLLMWAFVHAAGWIGLLAVVAGVFPWRALVLGHHAVAGAGLLGNPQRLQEAARSMSGSGRQWIDQVQQLRAGGRQTGRFSGAAKLVLGTGRSVWSALSPSVDGASSLRELAIWPKTISGLTAAAISPAILLVGAIGAAVAAIG
jgi:hypothetical protein